RGGLGDWKPSLGSCDDMCLEPGWMRGGLSILSYRAFGGKAKSDGRRNCRPGFCRPERSVGFTPTGPHQPGIYGNGRALSQLPQLHEVGAPAGGRSWYRRVKNDSVDSGDRATHSRFWTGDDSSETSDLLECLK